MTEWKDPESIPRDRSYVLVLDVYGQYFVSKYSAEGSVLKCNPMGFVDINYIKAWTELPEGPNYPDHNCSGVDLMCTSRS
jgi:hypothetical protein